MKKYQNLIKELYKEAAEYYQGSTNPLDIQLIMDTEDHHYQLLMLGWDDDDYTFQCLLHLDIKDGKIWIQWNSTEYSVEEELVKKGVPTKDIVLGLKHPDYRQYGDFAEA